MKTQLLTAFVGVSLLALAGCGNKDTLADFNNRCTMYGFKPGTLEFAKCTQRERDVYEAQQKGTCYIAHPLVYDKTDTR